MRRARPKSALEIGALVGYSTIRISRLLPKGGKLTSIEIDETIAKEAMKNIERAGLAGRVKLIVGDAKKVIPRLEGTFDFVFLDAEKEEYATYLSLIEPKLRRGSTVVADNVGVFADRMTDYLERVRNSGTYRSRFYEDPPSGDGIEVSVLK